MPRDERQLRTIFGTALAAFGRTDLRVASRAELAEVAVRKNLHRDCRQRAVSLLLDGDLVVNVGVDHALEIVGCREITQVTAFVGHLAKTFQDYR